MALALCLAAGVLAGCAHPLEVAGVTEIRANNGAAGLDVYAQRRRKGEKLPEMSGDQLVDVRAYEAMQGPITEMRGTELAGAKCAVKTNDYSAHVTTPARIRVPLYSSQSSPLTVTCEREGYRSGETVVHVYNKTKADRMHAAQTGAGLVGLFVVAAVNELTDDGYHDFIYQPVQVLMNPIRQASAGAQ